MLEGPAFRECTLPSAHSPLPAVYSPLLIVNGLLPSAQSHCPLPTVYCSLFIARCPLPVVQCLLPIVYCPLAIVLCPLPIVYGPLAAVHCPTFIAQCHCYCLLPTALCFFSTPPVLNVHCKFASHSVNTDTVSAAVEQVRDVFRKKNLIV
jgi:hypothetical protein